MRSRICASSAGLSAAAPLAIYATLPSISGVARGLRSRSHSIAGTNDRRDIPTRSIMSNAISTLHLLMIWTVVPSLMARRIGMMPDKWNIGPRMTAGVAIDRRSGGRCLPVSSS